VKIVFTVLRVGEGVVEVEGFLAGLRGRSRLG
jgi:hypothetical protein